MKRPCVLLFFLPTLEPAQAGLMEDYGLWRQSQITVGEDILDRTSPSQPTSLSHRRMSVRSQDQSSLAKTEKLPKQPTNP